MMRRCIKVLLVFICLLPFHYTLAEECSNKEIERLKELAKTIQIDSEFNQEDVVLGIYDSYIVTVSGLTEELYVMSKDYSVGFFYEDVVDGSAIEKISAKTDTFKIYSTKCSNEVLRTVDLKLKRYNQYSEYEECKGIDSLDVCNKFYDGFLSYAEFMKKIEEYNNKNKIDVKDVESFFEKNFYLIIIGGVLLVGIIVVFFIRNRKRNRLD